MVTIGDVKAAAQKQWPDAVSLNVQLVPKTASRAKAYRLNVYGTHNRLLTRITAPTIGQLCDRLKPAQGSKSQSTEIGDGELEVPTQSAGQPR